MSAEPHATDSFQNLLFSILRFHALTATYPTQITLISHAFKRARFLQLHCPAIRWPLAKLTYLGIDPPEDVTPKSVLEQGEREKGYGVWKGDWYGVGSVLGEKRVKRGWNDGVLGSLGTGKEEGVKGLLEWKGGVDGNKIYEDELPWDGEVG